MFVYDFVNPLLAFVSGWKLYVVQDEFGNERKILTKNTAKNLVNRKIFVKMLTDFVLFDTEIYEGRTNND